MPLVARQIVCCTPSLDALAEALTRCLRRQKLAPGAERLLVALLVDGHAAVLEPAAARVDFGLARLLSEHCPGELLALELDGAALAMRLRRFEAGEPRSEQVWPEEQPGPPGSTTTWGYVDVEQLAWSALRAAAVPAALRLLDEVELAEPGAGVLALLVRAGPQGVHAREVSALPPQRSEGEEPPVQPDSIVESQAGEVRALEVRRLAAQPCTESEAAALTAVEEALALRLCEGLAGDLERDRVPRPSFAYGLSREKQGALDALLDPARLARPRLRRLLDPERPPPLSHAGFNALCRAALARELPEAVVARASGLRLELASPHATLRLPLDEPYRRYLREEPPARDPAVPVIDRAFALLENPLPLAQWPADTALRSLLPTVIPERECWERASGSLAGNVRSGLVCDDGARIAVVDEALLARLGLGYYDALARAVQNLDRLSIAQPSGFSFFDLEFGRVVSASFDDPGGAGRVLSPLSRTVLLALLSAESCLAAVPTRDTLLACPEDDEDAEAWLREEARLRCAEGPWPIDPVILRLTEDRVEEL